MTVVIAGGGITGLAAAYELARAGVAVELLEASSELGGKLRTAHVDGFLVEDGPDSWIAYRPAAAVLARELGMGDQVIGTTDPRLVHIRTRGRFVPLPDGIGMVLPTRMAPFLATRLFSPLDKLRMARDLVLPRSAPETDVSIGTFLRRRLGQPLVDRLADPLIGGIYGAPVDELSLDAVVPQLRAAEREHRSLLLASLAQGRARRAAERAAPTGAKTSPFVSLRDGMGSLVAELVTRLEASRDVRIRLGAAVAGLERGLGGTIVRLEDGRAITADAVILATPARVSASSLAGIAPAASRALADIPHGSTGVVNLAYRADQFAERPAGHGFLVAGDERLAFGACTWSSGKWAGRAPDGFVLARAFLGKRGADLLGLDDGDIARIVHDDLARIAGIRGQPVVRRVARWRAAMPRYSLGHLDRVAALDAAMREHPDVLVIGAALRGVGVPECIDQGRSAAQRAIVLVGGSESAAA